MDKTVRTTPIIFAALLLVPAWSLTMLQAAEPAKPNILLIYTDDHGWADLGVQGVDKDIRTPNIDQLARDGVRCFRGYVSAPQCVPSRAGVMTGRYQERFGVEDNTKGPLPLSELTIAKRLKAGGLCFRAGGQVASRRRRHRRCGVSERPPAAQRGLRRILVRNHAAVLCLARSGRQSACPTRRVSVKDDRFRVIVQTEAALGFLDRRAAKPEQPWFLYLACFRAARAAGIARAVVFQDPDESSPSNVARRWP